MNIAGSRHPEQWDGPHPDNFAPATFDLIVDTTRRIIDAVQPRRTYYALETMPWIFPSSADEYLRLIRAIDRDAFAVHLDPVNMINDPAKAFGNRAVLTECFEKLGPHVRSVHAKDIQLSPELTVHLDEVVPGRGMLDYAAFPREVDRLDPDTPVLLEHMHDPEHYREAARHLRAVAKREGLRM